MSEMRQLDRFVRAQAPVYGQALAEIRRGAKESHWMWFIFPQIAGLGRSPTAQHFAIRDLDEAREYLAHPILGARLVECCRALLDIDHRSASEILGYPDDMKLKSSMTLFDIASGGSGVFRLVLDKFYDGGADQATIDILAGQK